MKPPLDILKILELLPHRYPFIMVDRVLEIVPYERILALKNVSMDEPFFQGHFPGQPIMPGVLIMEALAQAGGLLVGASEGKNAPPKSIYFMGMDKVKFRHAVVPGDQLMLDVKILREHSKAVKMYGTATVEGAVAAEGELLGRF